MNSPETPSRLADNQSKNSSIHQTHIIEQIETLGNQCVLCASCIESCPTYQVSLNENRSPRGRIALIRAIATEQISISSSLQQNLDSCLQCFSCSQHCPSKVDYPELIHLAKQLIQQKIEQKQLKSNKRLIALISEKILNHYYARKTFIQAFNFSKSIGLIYLIKKINSQLNSRLVSYLPEQLIPNNNAIKSSYKPIVTTTETVQLHVGCASSLFDPNLASNCIQLLYALSIDVKTDIIEKCCGAIAFRNAETTLATQQLNSLTTLTAEQKTLSLNSSCSSHLNKQNNQQTDIIDYLFDEKFELLQQINFTPLTQKSLLHCSCSVRNRLKNEKKQLQLISLIPQLEIKTFNKSFCCGAAGNQMQSFSQQADKIVQPYLQFIISQQIKLLISSDISCALHIRQQLEKIDYKVEVVHPVSLLYQQLKITKKIQE